MPAVNSSEDAAITAFHKLATIAHHRSDLYRLLALTFSNPTEAIIADLQTGALVASLDADLKAVALDRTHFGAALDRLADLTTECQSRHPAVLLSQLRVEYMRLFIGPQEPVAPIYETLHREPTGQGVRPMLLVSETALAVEQRYRQAGVEMITREAPDHLATELEFLLYLCRKEALAWQVEDNSAAKKWRRLEREFLESHLGVWGPSLYRQVQEQAVERFYQYMAVLAGVYLHMETGGFQLRA